MWQELRLPIEISSLLRHTSLQLRRSARKVNPAAGDLLPQKFLSGSRSRQKSQITLPSSGKEGADVSGEHVWLPVLPPACSYELECDAEPSWSGSDYAR